MIDPYGIRIQSYHHFTSVIYSRTEENICLEEDSVNFAIGVITTVKFL